MASSAAPIGKGFLSRRSAVEAHESLRQRFFPFTTRRDSFPSPRDSPKPACDSSEVVEPPRLSGMPEWRSGELHFTAQLEYRNCTDSSRRLHGRRWMAIQNPGLRRMEVDMLLDFSETFPKLLERLKCSVDESRPSIPLCTEVCYLLIIPCTFSSSCRISRNSRSKYSLRHR